MENHLYWYKADVVEVYDGDTLTVDLRLGYNFKVERFKIRMAGIDAPEIRGATKVAGTVARNFLRGRILGTPILFNSLADKPDKYGRFLGIVWSDISGIWLNVNQHMIDTNHAIPFMEGEIHAMAPKTYGWKTRRAA